MGAELAKWTAILVAAHQINQILDRITVGSVALVLLAIAVGAAIAWGDQCKTLVQDKLSLSYLLSRSWFTRSGAAHEPDRT